MEKQTLLEVIKENKSTIIRRALIVLGSVGGILLASKLLTGNEESVEDVEELEAGDVDFSEVENEAE